MAINIYGTLNNATPEATVATADQIKDTGKNKKQSELNADFERRVSLLESSPGGGGGIRVVDHGTSDVVFELTPNVLHRWGEVPSLTLTFGEGAEGMANEYMFEFASGAEPTVLGLPESVKWASSSAVEASKTYQVSILNNLAVMGGA